MPAGAVLRAGRLLPPTLSLSRLAPEPRGRVPAEPHGPLPSCPGLGLQGHWTAGPAGWAQTQPWASTALSPGPAGRTCPLGLWPGSGAAGQPTGPACVIGKEGRTFPAGLGVAPRLSTPPSPCSHPHSTSTPRSWTRAEAGVTGPWAPRMGGLFLLTHSLSPNLRAGGGAAGGKARAGSPLLFPSLLLSPSTSYPLPQGASRPLGSCPSSCSGGSTRLPSHLQRRAAGGEGTSASPAVAQPLPEAQAPQASLPRAPGQSGPSEAGARRPA